MPALSREELFDAIAERRTYATTKSRVYLEVTESKAGGAVALAVRAASEEGIREAVLVRNGTDGEALPPGADPRVVEASATLREMAPEEFCYVRVVTARGNMAWSSPVWGDEK